MDYADAMLRLEDEISSAIARGNSNGLSDAEIAAELRRIADEIEKE